MLGPSLRMQKKMWVPPTPWESVTCLGTDVCLTADPGVANSIMVRSHMIMK